MARDTVFPGDAVAAHYTAFLARRYAWIAGGTDPGIRQNTEFFRNRGLIHGAGRTAVDLGAGCGFQTIPLARAGYTVTAVDFCSTLLDELRQYAGPLPVVTICSDIRDYDAWEGLNPDLIVCMGDTITHLPTHEDIGNLICRCASELGPGGELVISMRDYSEEAPGEEIVIPVRRENNDIFLCRLEFHRNTVTVRDILYTRRKGRWARESSEYRKTRISPGKIAGLMEGAGFTIRYRSLNDGIAAFVAHKDP